MPPLGSTHWCSERRTVCELRNKAAPFVVFWVLRRARERGISFFPALSSGRYWGSGRPAQEPDQSLDVLRGGCKEELLSDELQPTQAQTMEADMTLQLSEQRLDLLSLSLCLLELRCRPEISRSLPSCFVHMDGKIPERSSRALRSLQTRTAFLPRSD